MSGQSGGGLSAFWGGEDERGYRGTRRIVRAPLLGRRVFAREAPLFPFRRWAQRAQEAFDRPAFPYLRPDWESAKQFPDREGSQLG